MARCLVYNTTLYTVYSRCGEYGRCMFIHWPMRPLRGLYGPLKHAGTDAGTALMTVDASISAPSSVLASDDAN